MPFLVTPFVENIWTKDTNMWLSERVPRICTYYEIEKICVDGEDFYWVILYNADHKQKISDLESGILVNKS